MTHDEHIDILTFLDSTMADASAPMDVEADAIIRAYFKRHPDAAYYITRKAMALAAQPAPPARPAAGGPRRWLTALVQKLQKRGKLAVR